MGGDKLYHSQEALPPGLEVLMWVEPRSGDKTEDGAWGLQPSWVPGVVWTLGLLWGCDIL